MIFYYVIFNCSPNGGLLLDKCVKGASKGSDIKESTSGIYI